MRGNYHSKKLKWFAIDSAYLDCFSCDKWSYTAFVIEAEL